MSKLPLNQWKYFNYWCLLVFFTVGSNIIASQKNDITTLQHVKKATKDVMPFTIGGFALSLAHEYRIAKKLKEFPRLSKLRIGRAGVAIMPPTMFGWFVAYKYEQLKRELND